MNRQLFSGLKPVRAAHWLVLLALALVSQGALAQTFLVNSVGDEPLATAGSISCISTAGTCTLRAAIQANNNRTSTFVTVSFNGIPVPPGGDGIHDGVSSRIILNSALPTITRRITILGETHQNFDADNGFQRVQIDGGNVTTTSSGLFISGTAASGTVIRNLAIRDAANHGISVSNANNVIIQANRLGLYNLVTLDVPAGNASFGVSFNNSSGSQLVGNRIADNAGGGVRIAGSGSSGLLIAGNIIGAQLLLNGNLTPRGNGGDGIHVLGSAGTGNELGRCVLIPGVSNFCQGNLIVANDAHGINIEAPGQQVVFNSIGLNADLPDNVNFGNAGQGIRVAAGDTFIGGGLVSGGGFSANVIGHNGGHGVHVVAGSNVTVASNRIGGSPDGQAFGNAATGVRIQAGSGHSIVSNLIMANNTGISSTSGPTSISNNEVIDNGNIGIQINNWRHVIEGNVVGLHGTWGIRLIYTGGVTDAAEVRDNWVGVRPNGDPIPNANGIGVNSGTAIIGGGVDQGNVIASNVFDGLVFNSSEGSTVRSNFIGVLPDGTARGNGRYGVAINGVDSSFPADANLVGYGTIQAIPAAHVPDGDGGGGLGNIIAHNAVGVRVTRSATNMSAERNRIRGNRIYANSDGGIQIFSSIGGINEGAGEGPNRLLNHPQLDDNAIFFNADTGAIEYRFRVPTQASQASYPLRIDFYLTEPGESQGRFYLGSVDYPAASANSWVSGSFTPVGGYSLANAMIVAMATDNQGNSSEFSASPADLSIGSPSPLDNIVISSFGDAPNADLNSTSCDTGNPFIAPGVPNCTLRAAIQAANNHTDPVTITFWEGLAAPGGVSTFAPQTQLPAIGSQVTLAGETHASFAFASGPAVRISGDQQASGHGLVVNGNQSTIRHVALTDFPQDGLRIETGGGVLVHDSLIGLAPSGGAFVAAGNGRHGVVLSAASGNELRDNWIGANTQRGVQIDLGAAANVLVGNRIGAGRTGDGSLVPAGNGNVGVITLASAGFDNRIGRCIINLPDPNPVCSGNVIVANGSAGISVAGGSQVLAANWVGVNPDQASNADFGNGGAAGIVLNSSNNQLQGGLQIGVGSNVIGHGEADGLLVFGDDNQIANVLVGITPGGSNVGNALQGIRIESGRGNVISSSRIANNVNGVVLLEGPNTVSASRIFDNQNNGVMVIDGGQWIDGNVIGDHGLAGILFGHSVEAGSDGLLRITNNWIGVDQVGENMANQVGIYGLTGGRANIGEVDGLGNVIAGNDNAGIVLDTVSNASIVNNHIGVLADGSAAGNGGAGIAITTSNHGGISLQNVVGYAATASLPAEPVGDGPGARGNVIANHLVGIVVNSSQNDPVLLRNSLRGNRFLANNVGIQLGEDAGGTDPGGAQDGPNRLQNPPEFDDAQTVFDEDSGQVVFAFRVDTLATNANYPIRVDFYLDNGGQGGTYLHTEVYGSADATQFVSGSFAPPVGVNLVGASLIGMATDDAGNSSEFSVPVSLGELSDELFSDRFEQ